MNTDNDTWPIPESTARKFCGLQSVRCRYLVGRGGGDFECASHHRELRQLCDHSNAAAPVRCGGPPDFEALASAAAA